LTAKFIRLLLSHPPVKSNAGGEIRLLIARRQFYTPDVIHKEDRNAICEEGRPTLGVWLCLACLIASLLGCQAEKKQELSVNAYVDCHSDHFVVYPGELRIPLDNVHHPTGDLDFVRKLQELRSNSTNYCVLATVRPNSILAFRDVRYAARLVGVTLFSEPVDSSFHLSDSRAISSLQLHLPREDSSKTPIFFECREGEVFYFDKSAILDRLSNFAYAVKSQFPQPPKDYEKFLTVFAQQACTEYYTVNVSDRPGIISIESRPGVHGENEHTCLKKESHFQQVLDSGKPESNSVVFLLRTNSFPVFRVARAIAEKKHFQTSWEFLNTEETIMFSMPNPWRIYCP
jgi:hypothetical protein